MKEFSALNFG